MKKRIDSKLKMRIETLRELRNDQLAAVQGGGPGAAHWGQAQFTGPAGSP